MSYKHSSQKCNLFLAQKVAIAWFEGAGLLHKWTELLCKCQHRNKSIVRTQCGVYILLNETMHGYCTYF